MDSWLYLAQLWWQTDRQTAGKTLKTYSLAVLGTKVSPGPHFAIMTHRHTHSEGENITCRSCRGWRWNIEFLLGMAWGPFGWAGCPLKAVLGGMLNYDYLYKNISHHLVFVSPVWGFAAFVWWYYCEVNVPGFWLLANKIIWHFRTSLWILAFFKILWNLGEFNRIDDKEGKSIFIAAIKDLLFLTSHYNAAEYSWQWL